jgi:hypothetical protein
MSVLVRKVAIVSEISEISPSELTRVAAALQEQATRDFGPIWGVNATVDAFASLDDIPLDAWPIMIQTDIHESGAAGIHLDRNGQPFALVQFDNAWSLTASHECLEMLADPFGSRQQAAPSPKPGDNIDVLFLVEVSDPCEALSCAYAINGVTVSDFITPQFYDRAAAIGVRYDFTGKITKPGQVLRDGYVSWLDPRTQRWGQLTMFGGNQVFRDLGPMSRGTGSLREAIDSVTPTPIFAPGGAERAALLAAVPRIDAPGEATRARARTLRDDMSAAKARAATARQDHFPEAKQDAGN